MTYQVLARKLRPASFDGLIGQEHVVRTLVHALNTGRVHHAYLFTGTRGVGKTTVARIVAKALNCETGVTATPCGECGICREIVEGRFADLIEVDAASKTGVDATRDLLDNAQYLPARGRYKVYLIDEVHMLSTHSFNALLKTLEEPPEHVKFLLATTDPKKVPVTVLSRCLQFQLKNLLPEKISAYVGAALRDEGIAFDEEALSLIARAARGSMRDALSLTDQAIAHGAGRLSAPEVGAMLGTVNRDELAGLLQRLADGDGPGLLALCGELAAQAADFVEVLRGLLVALHDIAVAQTVGGAGHQDEPFVAALAPRLAPETVQLFYQIVLLGLKDLQWAPDPQLGFEMVMMRLLAFEPLPDDAMTASGQAQEQAVGQRGRAAGTGDRGDAGPRGQHAAGAASVARIVPAPPPRSGARAPERVVSGGVPDDVPAAADAEPPANADTWRAHDWNTLVDALPLAGVARMIVEHCVPVRTAADAWTLCLDRSHDTLLNEAQERTIGRALEAHLQQPVRLRIVPGTPPVQTPAACRDGQRRADFERAVAALENDRHVRALVDAFDAELDLDTVRPVKAQ